MTKIYTRLSEDLLRGELKRFRDWPDRSIPAVAAGVYAIWDTDGRFIYVGMSGREISRRKGSTKPYGLVTRLGSHASGRLSGDQFCVYVANRIVIPELHHEELERFRDGSLTLDMLVKEFIRERLLYRYVLVEDEKEAMGLEEYIRMNGLGGEKALLNGKG